MRILLINKYHFIKGGAEKSYFDLAQILEQHGHQVAYFAMEHPSNQKTPWQKYFISNIDYQTSQSLWQKIIIAFKTIYNIEARQKLRQLIKEFKPDIAHLHNIYHQLSPSIIDELKKQNIPMVMTLHDYKLVCPNYNMFVRGQIWEKTKKHQYWRCFTDRGLKDSWSFSLVGTIEAYFHYFRQTYQKINTFIAPSKFLAHKFQEFGFSQPINHLPYPLTLPELKTSTKITENYLLFFGRLSPEKSVDDVILAYQLAKPAIKLYITGDGPERERLEKLAENNPNIIFTGYQQGQSLENIISQAQLIIFSSRWYDNYPYVILESMAKSKIILAAQIGGLPEMIKNNKTGFLYPPGDVPALAQLITEKLQNYSQLKEIGRAARVQIKDLNDPELFYQKLLSLYQKTLADTKMFQ